ncbi:MAG: hypothetical protein KHY76_08210 [Butyricicoccus pullicaecorum]|nr:hypothetical protein [Butyricicoccus pullicaecorum]
MKQKYIPFLSLVLCAALLIGITTSYAANNITLTAVNDSFLPLSSSTMPEKRGGAQYVPYSVFSGALGISSAYNSADQTLSLSSGTTVLRFDLSRGTVYDQNMNSYTTPAYWINGTIYVPVKLVCGKFNLTYSNISAAAPILRICSSAAALSDSAFVSSSANTIRSMLEAYNKPTSNPAPQGGQTNQPSPVPSAPPTVPLRKPSTVYLTYFGAPDSDTLSILTALEQAEQSAAFFIPADGTELNEDLLRQIVGRGHTIGFTLLSSAQDMTAKLRAANDVLFHATGTVSRLLCISDGSENLTAIQREGLIQGGYRLWDTTVDSQDHSYGAADAVKATMDTLGQITVPTVIRLGHYKSSARATALLISQLAAYDIPIGQITLTQTPINHLT